MTKLIFQYFSSPSSVGLDDPLDWRLIIVPEVSVPGDCIVVPVIAKLVVKEPALVVVVPRLVVVFVVVRVQVVVQDLLGRDWRGSLGLGSESDGGGCF